MKAPDHMTAVQAGSVNGFHWCVIRAPVEGGNGYVQLPPDHPWFGKDYEHLKVQAPGGLTYSRPSSDGSWWIGFDTAHVGDYWSKAETDKLGPPMKDGKEAKHSGYSHGPYDGDTHWTVSQLVVETRNLAAKANRAYKDSKK